MASRFKPIFESLSEAAVRGARHADTRLPQLTRNHTDQIDLFKGKIDNLDTYDGPGSGTDSVTTNRGRNRKTTVYDTESGRPIYEDGVIHEDFGGGRRGDNATQIGRLGNPGDHGGHLGAHRFFGDTPDQGIVPQAASLNLGAWKRMENHWVSLVDRGLQVDYSIDVYPPGSIRPERFDVFYTVTDPNTGDMISEHTPTFPNERGATFTP